MSENNSPTPILLFDDLVQTLDLHDEEKKMLLEKLEQLFTLKAGNALGELLGDEAMDELEASDKTPQQALSEVIKKNGVDKKGVQACMKAYASVLDFFESKAVSLYGAQTEEVLEVHRDLVSQAFSHSLDQ